MTYHAKVIAGGKIVLPAELRREFGIKDGDSLVVERGPAGGLSIKTYEQVVREVQARFREMTGQYHGTLSDELIAERRQEAALEFAKEERERRASPA